MDKFIVDTSDTYFLDNIYNDIDILCEKYSSVLSKIVIGKSVEGRDIVALKVSGGKTDEILRCAQDDENGSFCNDKHKIFNGTTQRSFPTNDDDNNRSYRDNIDDENNGSYHDAMSEIFKSVQNDRILAIESYRKSIVENNKLKPSVLLVGGIHAREDFSVMLCMKMIDYYCHYYSDRENFDGFDVKKIIDQVDMYFVPVANPDGLNIVHHGLEASSNYEALKVMQIWGEDHTYWKSNANGVDLNKNFDDGNWEIRTCVPGTEVPCSDRFKGFSPNSEPETGTLINFCNDNNFSLMVTYHCSGNCTFWADNGTHHMFNGLDEKIMDDLNKKYIYRKTKVSMDPKVYGSGFENWFRAKMKRPAFCIELSPFVEGGKQHPDSMFNELVWEHAKTTGLFFAEKAIEVCDEIYGDVEKYAALTR